MTKTTHWADKYAEKIIEKKPDKKEYTIEAAITPSGVVHAGNFREIITQYLVHKSLKEKGEKSRYIYFWDDYDRFRKVPKGIDQSWEKYIGLPVSETPDPWECHDSYAEHFKNEVIEEIGEMDLGEMDFKSASEEYKEGTFTELIRKALENKEEIREIINRYREEPHGKEWIPIRVYCEKCGKDTTTAEYIGEYKLKYRCECGEESVVDFKEKPGSAKLPWRIDWPMRWKHYDVDFESSGKEHQASGGSVDTAIPISKQVFNQEPPIQPMYEFISIKGQKEKMSSSKGNVVRIKDLLEIYESGVILYLYTSKINKAFDIAFDEEIINIYNRFDRAEKAYFEDGDENEARRYELSVREVPKKQPQRIPFGFCSTIAQVAEDEERRKKILERTGHLENPSEKNIELALKRIELAGNWIDKYASNKYKYKIQKEMPEEAKEIDEKILEIYEKAATEIEKGKNGQEIQQFIYEAAKEKEIPIGKTFQAGYKLILGKKQGPRLGPFLATLNEEFVLKRLRRKE
ncbi:MAG: lysine--tRNA ligase [archaeon]